MSDVSQNLSTDGTFCRDCGKPIKKEAEICPHCGVRQKEIPNSVSKSPGLAAIASFFFSGLGQIYNGEFSKGLTFIVVQFINVGLMFLLIGFITYPLVWFYGIFDAYKSAERINQSMGV